MLQDRNPPVYFPIDRGLYEIGPGFRPLGHDFGNGKMDSLVFQFDREFPRFQQEKQAARKENLTKYFGVSRLAPDVLAQTVDFFLEKLPKDHPEFFQLNEKDGVRTLHCKLTNEILNFDSSGNLVTASGGKATPPYSHAIDALVNQIQEDFAIVSTKENENWLSAMHVCGPSHWDPREKLGKDFLAVHAPIPGFDKVGRAHLQIVDAMVNKGPFVRFVWSFVTDTRLNHHPEAPVGEDAALWKGRSFSENADGSAPFHLRVERQLTFGLPRSKASLFFIRLSFIDGNILKANERWNSQLVSALQSMTPESRVYKGVSGCFDELVSWLQNA